MSKATGNFLTADEAIRKYGADAVRFALADAGDGLDDANFREETANNAVLRLYNLLATCQELLAASAVCYPESYEDIYSTIEASSADCIHECVFLASILDCTLRACSAFERCSFREGLIISFNELGHSRDQYIHSCETKSALLPLSHRRVRQHLPSFWLLYAHILPKNSTQRYLVGRTPSSVIRSNLRIH